ncbi:uncharacterized protein [Battus philenor]|uniref:uncharacterized protein n=1 Tax=Battus philenor TaxID=42288 RepID=UPI0035D13027
MKRATCKARAAAAAAVVAVPAVVSAANAPNRGKRFCVYCKKSGHNRDECSRLRSKSDPHTVSCYGCDAVNNETLLGIDFIRKAGLVIDNFNETWFTADQPQVIHPLRCEKSRNFIGCASADMLRSDEGMMLSPPERASLAQTLQEYEDIFREGGGPTSFAEHRIDTGTHPPIAVPPYRLTPAKKESIEHQQDLRKAVKDKIRKSDSLDVGDLVLMKTHVLSNSAK